MGLIGSDLDRAMYWAGCLEEEEARSTGLPISEARGRVASREKLTPGLFENLRKGRLKDIRASAYRALQAAMVRSLQRSIRLLEHELAITRAAGLGEPDDMVRDAEAALAQAREALRRGTAG